MQKLNQKGYNHALIPLFIVVMIGIGGTYALVNSHAMSGTPSSLSSNKYKTPGGTRRRIVEVAKSELGYSEGPNNTVKFWETKVPNPPLAEYWCADFATWVWHVAGIHWHGDNYPRQPAVSTIRDTGRGDHRLHMVYDPHTGVYHPEWYTPKPGDMILYGPEGGGDNSHVGIVQSASTKRVITIEGNAGNGPGSVIRRKFDRKHLPADIPHGVVYGYVTPPGV